MIYFLLVVVPLTLYLVYDAGHRQGYAMGYWDGYDAGMHKRILQ